MQHSKQILTVSLIFILIFILGGCVSLQWRDDEGLVRHVGFFTYEYEQLYNGVKLSKSSLGLDVRLEGQDQGASFGLKTIEGIQPACYDIGKISDMSKSVLSYENWPQVPEEKRLKKRGFFYLKENLTNQMIFVSSMCIGVDLRTGPISPGIAVGKSDYNYVSAGSTLDNLAYLYNKKEDSYISLIFQENVEGRENENKCEKEVYQLPKF